MKILFAASEAFPFIKTGGLGDVIHSLPQALSELGDDVRLVLPAYKDVLAAVDSIKVLAETSLPGVHGSHSIRILQVHEDVLGDYLYLVDAPSLFDRPGNPYMHHDGYAWPDNAERYTVFSRAVALIGTGELKIGWKPKVVHCHDWQTGLVPAFIKQHAKPPRTIFTIHNLAYDGFFTYSDFAALGLPAAWWSSDAIEFYGGMSMLKAGMVFSDRVTTVSPTYAKEICTPAFGYRFEGILQYLGKKLSGILNGIDVDVWNPATDTHIAQTYSYKGKWIVGKHKNKQALLELAGFPLGDAPLLGFIGRLVEQKGIDSIIKILPEIFTTTDANVAILGSGHLPYEVELQELADKYPDRLYVHFGYSEKLAHQIEAGADMFLMPSRFEPCGLNQMYSLRYGTPPIVNNTGGLSDTVIDADKVAMSNKTANGFVLQDANEEALLSTVGRAINMYRKPAKWHQICRTGMKQDLGWETSAKQYQKLYRSKSK